VSEKQLL